MGHRLRPIQTKKISDQVFDQLSELIMRGDIKPAEKLMSERELSRTLNVSRTAVREAINKLAMMGMLEQKRGQGTFVTTPHKHNENPIEKLASTQNLTLDHVLEIRLALECNGASIAAERATDEDLTLIKESIDRMASKTHNVQPYSEVDIGFHMAIAFATKNPLYVHTIRTFFDYLFFIIKDYVPTIYNLETCNQYLSQHMNIYKAIEQKDAQEAYNTMKKHLVYVPSILSSNL